MSGLRLLAVHAHPDDEASKGAATMAKYADEGVEVMVVTATGGERGDILNPAMDRPGIRENMVQVRRDEMAASAKALGVEHRWLGYVDSGLPEGDPLPPLPQGCFALADAEEAATKLVAIIREFRPQVILTYDELGGYPHPDHIKVHDISMIAWKHAGDPDFAPETGEPFEPLKLYYMHGFIPRRFKLFHEYFLKQGLPSPYQEVVDMQKELEYDVFQRVTTQIDASDYFDRRDRALAAHATQIDPDGLFLATPLKVQRELWPTEEFELADSRVGDTLPEDDLFAGIRDLGSR